MNSRPREDDPSETRTLRQKMEDMALQSDASPREAAFAQAWLDSHPVRALTREAILDAPDERASVREVRYWEPTLQAYVVMEVDSARATSAVEEFERAMGRDA